MTDTLQLNEHNKEEYPPMHTTELEASSIVIYTTADNQISLEVKMNGDTVWLTQGQMAELFGRDRTVIGRHIKSIFQEGELKPEEVCANFAHTTRHGSLKG